MMLRGYYAILDVPGRVGSAADVKAQLARAGRLLGGQPCMLQVRAKAWGAGALAALARAIHPMARAVGVPLCVNDRLDVALAVGAEAVHLGQEDVPLADARLVAARRMMVGVSTHTPAQAEAAMTGGADYIGFGPVYSTATKTNPDPVVGIDGLRTIAGLASARAPAVPVVAIGGITLARIADVAAAGANAVALIGAIDTAPDAAAAGRAVNAVFAAI